MAEQSFSNYLTHNLFGNSKAGTWNVLPAVLSTWSNLLSTKSSETSYELYRQQARSYIDTAQSNAELIKNQGAIALRNLQYKNKLERGNDIVRVAAGNGKLSGSNLDVLVRKEKIRKMNEQTLNANYTIQAMLELTNGYKKAANEYGALAAKAGADKYAALASILKGVETYMGLTVRDAKVQSKVTNAKEQTDFKVDAEKDNIDYEYGTGKYSRALSGDGKDYSNEAIISNRDTLANNYEINFR